MLLFELRPRAASCLLAVVACLVAQTLPQALGARASELNACLKWPQNRLFIGRDLQSGQFMLEPQGSVQLLPPLVSGFARHAYHRTFSLALDVADPISLFYGNGSKTCVVGRDQDRKKPLKLPVFFLGRSGGSREELKEAAETVAFAPSASLRAGDNFADVAFRLRRGGSRVSQIRPFFQCGLPGLLLCEDYCPADSVALATSFVNWVMKGEPSPSTSTPALANEKPDPVRPRPENPRVESTPPLPAPSAALPRPETAAPPPPPLPASRAPDTALLPGPAPVAKPADRATETPPAPVATPPLPKRVQTIIAFARAKGGALQAADVLQAEGLPRIEGTPLSATAQGMSADLTEQLFREASDIEFLRKLFPHHSISAVKTEEGRITVTAEPLYVRADDLQIKISDSTGEKVRDCDLALDVSANRRLGAGWSKTHSQEKLRGLIYVETDTSYRLDLPGDIDESELLIDTAEPGNAARLSNVAAGCVLEARPWVDTMELKSSVISRSLQVSGPTLIALLTTDSTFENFLRSSEVQGFWAGALGLVSAVSKQHWERRIIARAQAPGAHQFTRAIGEIGDGGAIADEGSLLGKLEAGSREQQSSLAIVRIKPVERFHLDIALRLIRSDARISNRTTSGKEALLFVSGSLKTIGSYFCRYPLRRDSAPWATPQWFRQARVIFALEVWSEAAAESMRSASRATRPDDAPEGIYVCILPGADGGKIALYAMLPSALTGEAERFAAFNYLRARAESFLKPEP